MTHLVPGEVKSYFHHLLVRLAAVYRKGSSEFQKDHPLARQSVGNPAGFPVWGCACIDSKTDTPIGPGLSPCVTTSGQATWAPLSPCMEPSTRGSAASIRLSRHTSPASWGTSSKGGPTVTGSGSLNGKADSSAASRLSAIPGEMLSCAGCWSSRRPGRRGWEGDCSTRQSRSAYAVGMNTCSSGVSVCWPQRPACCGRSDSRRSKRSGANAGASQGSRSGTSLVRWGDDIPRRPNWQAHEEGGYQRGGRPGIPVKNRNRDENR